MTRLNLTGYQAAYLETLEKVGPVPFDPALREEVEDLAREGLIDLGTLRPRVVVVKIPARKVANRKVGRWVSAA